MSDDIKQDDMDGEKKPRGKTLSLKRTVESGQVRQSFSHGRSKAVVVEKRRKRIITKGKAFEDQGVAQAAAEDESNRNLSKAEQEARAAAVVEAKKRAVDEAKKEEEEQERREQERQRRAAEKTKREEEARALREAEEKRRLEEEQKSNDARRKADSTSNAAEEEKPSKLSPVRKRDDEESEKRPARKVVKGERRRREGKLTIHDALNEEERQRSLASIKRRREREKRQIRSDEPAEKISRTVTVPETIIIQELANRMAERAVDVIKVLMQQGMMVKINDVIDADTAQLVAEDLGHKVKRVSESDVEEGVMGDDDHEDDKLPRPPVVTVMGHVDHGKTSLLDKIRQARVAAGEAGGITQHIGAYQTMTESGSPITFIDTPGHAAFTAMRARGAKVTDIVVLVVAADDGVMPQTVEAIEHARAAQAPLIVAINKMDKPEADPARVKNDLLRHEVIAEDMGGDAQMIEVSAHSGQGLDDLLEAISLQAEVMELKANPTREGEGIVIEAKLDKGRGAVATILMQRGTLRKGDIFVVGQESGRVRALINDQGVQVDEAGPSVPVEVLGGGGAPQAGDIFNVVETEAQAREVADYRARKAREAESVAGARGSSLDQMLKQLKESEQAELPLLVKGDVQGSVEAIAQAVAQLDTEEVCARIILTGVGGITESDITLASASGAVVIGFNVRANAQARSAAEQTGIEIRYYNIIYDLVDDVRAAMSGLLSPDLRETMLGTAEVLEIFSVGKGGKAAGGRVTEGLVRRGAKVRLIRDDVVIHEGDLSSLRRFKDEVSEVANGQECGMAFEDYTDLRAGDMIECYEVEEVARKLDA